SDMTWTKQIAALALVFATGTGITASRGQVAAARVIEVSAQRFEFWPSELRVREGKSVELRVSSDDTMHGFRIVGAGVNVAVPKRGRGHVTVRLPSLAPGRYSIECSRMCGAGHNFMRATLLVESATEVR